MKMKKTMSWLLSIAMILSMLPAMAFAAELDTGLCDHHTEHTVECGYVAAVEGVPCGHAHDETCGYAEAILEVLCTCTATDENGALVHTEGCGYVAPVAGVDCTHVHDDACGYVAAQAEQPCSYECAGCAIDLPICTCSIKCTEETINTDCAACNDNSYACIAEYYLLEENNTLQMDGITLTADQDTLYHYESDVFAVYDGYISLTLPEGQSITLGLIDSNGGIDGNTYLAAIGDLDVAVASDSISLTLDTGEAMILNKTGDFAGYTYACSDGTIELTYGRFYSDDGMISSGSNSNGTLTITGEGGGNADVFCGFALAETDGSATFLLDGSDETLIGGAISRVKDEPQIISLKTGTVKNLYSPDDLYDYSIYLYLDQDIGFSLSSEFTISCENYTVTDIYWEEDPNNFVTAVMFNMPGNTWLNYQDKTIYAQSDAYVTFVYYGDSGYKIYDGDLYPENQVHFDGTNDAVVGKEHETETYKGLTVTGNPDGIHTAQCNCEELCEYANWKCPICSFGADCCQYGKAEKETMLLINKAGLYTISGSGENVSILVSNSRNTTLVLNNVSITAPEGLPAIAAQGPLTLLVNGTNTITGGSYDYAALDLRSPCIIANEADGGVLNVNGAEYTDEDGAAYANAIYSDCDLTINNVTVNATGATGVFMFDDEDCALTVGKNGALNAAGVTNAGIYEASVTVENSGKISAAGGEKQPLAISSDSPVYAGDLILGDPDADDFDGANADLKAFTIEMSEHGVANLCDIKGIAFVQLNGIMKYNGETVESSDTPMTITYTVIDPPVYIPTYTPSEPTFRPTIEESEHGEVTVNKKHPEKGDRVTITAVPDKGYEIGKVTVTDRAGDPVEVIDNGDGTFTYKQPYGKVSIEVTYVPADAGFLDVVQGSYYEKAVNWAAAESITAGTSATTFSPNAPCTRAQMATFLWRAAGSPEPVGSTNPFADVPADAYYTKAIQWAYEQGITGGTSATTFSPDATCTRGQMATFLWRNAGSQAPESNTNQFTDVPVEKYYATAVQWAYEQKITSGTSATTFSPNDPCTRAQMVTFLYRFFVK